MDGSFSNSVRETVLLTFVLEKLSGFKIYCEPEAKEYIFSSFLIDQKRTFLWKMRREKVDFNGETITFTLILLKIIVQTCQYVEINTQPNSKLDDSKNIGLFDTMFFDIVVNKNVD